MGAIGSGLVKMDEAFRISGTGATVTRALNFILNSH
jgi:hypothetical protein